MPYRRHEAYLIRSLGTPDGLRALGEFVRSTAFALSLFLITALMLFRKHSFAGTMLRVAVVLALNKVLGAELVERERLPSATGKDMSTAEHVSKRMLKHYSRIRTAAKRVALDAIAQAPKQAIFGVGVHQNVHQFEEVAFDAVNH